MSIFSNLFKKKSNGELPKEGFFVGSSNSFFQKQNKDYVGWVYACVQAIINEIATIEFYLYKYDKNGNKEIITSHPALDLLYNPSTFFTKYNIFERLQANLELRGNEYWFIDFDKSGNPLEIYPLQSESITPIADKKEYIAFYEYRIGGEKFILPRERVIHFKTFNPYNDLVGVSTLSAVRSAAQTDEAAKQYNESFFKNSAIPSVVLEYPSSLRQEQAEQARKSFEDNFSGFKNAYKVAVAHSGMKVQTIEMTHTDMQFLEGRKANRDEILGIFRVPKTVLGIVEDVNFASAKAANYVFGLRNIKPKMERIVDTLTHFFLPMYGETQLEFGFKSPVQEDVEEQIQLFTAGLNNGFLSHNDVRRQLGLQELVDGEQFYMPMNLIAFSGVKTKTVKDNNIVTKGIVEEATKKAFEFLKKKELEDQQKKIGIAKLARIKNVSDVFEKRFQDTAQKLFDDQLERAIANLNKEIKSIKADVPELLDYDREVSATIDLFTPLFGNLTEQEAKEALRELGLDPNDFDLNSPTIQEFIKSNTKKFAGVITDTTVAAIRSEVIAGISQGEGAVVIARRLRENFAFSSARAERIARTEVIRGVGLADQEAWKQTGIVKYKEWVTAPTCDHEECLNLNGKKIKLDAAFIREESLERPYDGDITAPPLHPNCKCVLIPIVE